MADQFLGIYRAALEIALDNGGVNRGRPVEEQKREFEGWIAKQPQDLLPAISAWLAGLSSDDLCTVCTGESSEIAALLRTAPAGTDDLLDRYFNEVC